MIEESIKDRERRAYELFNEDGFFEQVLDSLSHGRTLSEIAENQNIPFYSLHEWIYADMSRKERADNAYQMGARYIVDELLRETREISHSDFRKLFGNNGQLLPVNQWPEGAARTVESVEVKELFEYTGESRELVGYTKKIKLWNKNQAVKVMGQEFGIFKDKKEVSVDDDLKQMLARSYKAELEDKSGGEKTGGEKEKEVSGGRNTGSGSEGGAIGIQQDELERQKESPGEPKENSEGGVRFRSESEVEKVRHEKAQRNNGEKIEGSERGAEEDEGREKNPKGSD